MTGEEWQAVEALAGSRKSEARMQERTRIVLLLAAEGMASRAGALKLGCVRGMVSKWRVRYARDRMSGLSDTGDRAPSRNTGWIMTRAFSPCRTGRRTVVPTGRRRCWRVSWEISAISISGASTMITLLLRNSAPIRRRS